MKHFHCIGIPTAGFTYVVGAGAQAHDHGGAITAWHPWLAIALALAYAVLHGIAVVAVADIARCERMDVTPEEREIIESLREGK